MFTKSFDLSRTSVCVRSRCQMAKYSLTLTAHPVPYPPFLQLSPYIREKSCNYCTSVTVETTSQQSGFETAELMVRQDGVRSRALKLEDLNAPKHLLNNSFRSLCESTGGYRHFHINVPIEGQTALPGVGA